ncbi:hypothetical protein VitviT2T_021822 [Vitis vinifera]|uniref:Retrovirus-related Pol polyprotein from transposon RE1 n=1 Tax=Vitis vinifera TaxID=29760 RepID=A0ABY9D8U2_VITVI|nr:hypothetical protein VitviT2T_021822 [Vitis vinifera]
MKASCGCSAILHVDPTRNCILSQHFHAPTDIYWKSTTRILRYLKGTVNHGIYFSKRTLALTAYYDVDWARDAINRRSTTGYNIFLGPCLVSRCARKQSVVSRSGTSNGGDRIILDTYVVERPPSHFAFTTYGMVLPLQQVPFTMHALNISRLIFILYVKKYQIGDFFTKGLSSARFQMLCDKLMVCDLPICLRGGVGGVRLSTIDGTSNSKANHDVQLDLTVDESQS